MKSSILLSALVFIGSAGAHADGDFLPVCQRTPAVSAFLASTTQKTCDQITEADLAAVLRVAVPGAGITVFKAGDFSGLPNLQILNIQGNPFAQLTPGMLDALPNLQTLVLFDTGLTSIPGDFLAKNPLIEDLYMFGDQFTSLPTAVLDRFQAYTHWQNLELDKPLDTSSGGRITQIFGAKGGVNLVLD